MILDIDIADPRWEALQFEPLALTAITATLDRLGLEPSMAEISILACDDGRIKILNEDFRAKPQPTNVLSWPAQSLAPVADGEAPHAPHIGHDGMLELGDIAIAYDTCAREAQETKIEIRDHTTHLIIHGTLHLLGYDHTRDRDAALMEGLETEILGTLGISNPYYAE